MTVIAFDGRFMVADRMVSNQTRFFSTNKLIKLNKGIVGCAGNNNKCEELSHWFLNDQPQEKHPFTKDKELGYGLYISNQGKIFLYDTSSSFPTKIDQRYMSIGIGGQGALVAMHLGMDAIDAVKAVNARVLGCGRGYNVFELVNEEFVQRPELEELF